MHNARFPFLSPQSPSEADPAGPRRESQSEGARTRRESSRAVRGAATRVLRCGRRGLRRAGGRARGLPEASPVLGRRRRLPAPRVRPGGRSGLGDWLFPRPRRLLRALTAAEIGAPVAGRRGCGENRGEAGRLREGGWQTRIERLGVDFYLASWTPLTGELQLGEIFEARLGGRGPWCSGTKVNKHLPRSLVMAHLLQKGML
ncbi:uncharacterized protein LOC111826746 [Myotis lucifugus]|uniref:uncharacterized protein LOC111826746 n=1 Tax=Myotis lucifugus TaxID=59463 RepID=UPI000CCBE14B|nr:uncharacterized protein LOC111826746 [Myotis lucifugus]